MERKLTPRQRRFAEEYVVDLNATRAAIRAGYKANAARNTGCRLMTNSEVAREIARLKERQFNTIELTAERILLEMARIALLDTRKIFDEDGKLLPVRDWPAEVAACVSSIEVVRRYVPNEEVVEYLHRIRLWDKNTALTNLAKHFKLLRETIDVHVYETEREVDEQIERLLADALARSESTTS